MHWSSVEAKIHCFTEMACLKGKSIVCWKFRVRSGFLVKQVSKSSTTLFSTVNAVSKGKIPLAGHTWCSFRKIGNKKYLRSALVLIKTLQLNATVNCIYLEVSWYLIHSLIVSVLEFLICTIPPWCTILHALHESKQWVMGCPMPHHGSPASDPSPQKGIWAGDTWTTAPMMHCRNLGRCSLIF